MSGKPRPCGCKGFRTCLLCEEEFNLVPFDDNALSAETLKENVFIYVSLILCQDSLTIFHVVTLSRVSLLMSTVQTVILHGLAGTVIT